MKPLRKLKNQLMTGVTWLSSAFSLFVLVAILLFLFKEGWSSLDPSLLTDDYLATTVFSKAESKSGVPAGSFVRPADLEPEDFFSTHYGFALRDEIDREKNKVQRVTYVSDSSPLRDLVLSTAVSAQGEKAPFEKKMVISRMELLDSNGKKVTHGHLKGENAEQLVQALDHSEAVLSLQAKKPGGGIRGSLLATLLLIVLTMIFALPLSLGAALYLQRVAKPGRLTRALRASINLLAGVPTILFGMMGMTVIFPLLNLLGVGGPSILLGSLSLAVLLLPVLTRQIEEALMAVPAQYTQNSYALGATETQTLRRVILPAAMPGILSAFLMGISRVIGESAALIFTMGTAIQDHISVTGGATSLAVHIWVLMGGENPNFQLASAISIFILFLVLALNFSIKILVGRLTRERKKA